MTHPFFVRRTGSGSRRVLFIHGFLGTSGDAAFLDSLPDAEIFAPDLPGHGKSGPLLSPDVATIETLPGKLAEALQPHGPFDLICGYSMGGRIVREWMEKSLLDSPRWLFFSTFFGFSVPMEAANRRNADREKANRLRENPGKFLSEWDAQPVLKSQNCVRPARMSDAETCAALLERFSPGFQPLVARKPAQASLGVVTGTEDTKFKSHSLTLRPVLAPDLFEMIPGAGHRVHLDQPAACRNAAARLLALC